MQSAHPLDDEQLLARYRQLLDELLASGAAVSSASAHGQLYQRLAQQLYVPCDWDQSVAFGSSPLRWTIFEDAPGALQYLSKFYRLILIAPPPGVDVASLTQRLPVAFDAVIEPHQDDWHHSLEQALDHLGLARSELLPVRSTETDDPWSLRVDFPVCTLRRDHRQPWNHSPQALDGKRCEYASLADLAYAHQKALHA